MGAKTPGNCPFPLQHVNHHLIHQCLGQFHLPPQMTARSVHSHLCNKVPICYNGTTQIHPQNFPFPLMITTPSNTPIPRLIPLTVPNGIWIQSAILPKYTFRFRQTHRHTLAHRPTDGIDDGSTPLVLTLAILTESGALII